MKTNNNTEKKRLVFLNLKKSQKKFQNVQISKELRDIIHGYIMSDGYVKPEGNLQVDNCVDQESFVEWMYKKLEFLRTNNPIGLVKRYDKRTKKYTYSKRFFTRNLLKGFHKMWYSANPEHETKGGTKYRKHLPKSLDCFFSPTLITVWFAGDGTKTPDHRGAKLEVTSFTPEERIRLKTLFKKKFKLNVGIIRSGFSKSGIPQFAIVIYSEEYETFRELITQSDLIPTCFPNKLHKKANP
jgi:hypothetical protein